jgi:hypothetical protein
MATVAVAVGSASSDPVIAAGARLGIGNPSFPFLQPQSPIEDDRALDFIENILDTVHTPADVGEFATFLAIATHCHALDGWRYLSKAAYSLLSGSRNTALHLAYYAELRAAMSILSGGGIGILNGKHFSIDKNSSVTRFGGGTHIAAWEAISAWAKVQANARLVIEVVGAAGLNGLKWADACRLTHTRESVAEHWLGDWSVDIHNLTLDRELRNVASYRPNLFSNAYDPISSDDLSLVLNASRACILGQNGQIDEDEIDVALMADLCHKAGELTCGQKNVPLNDPAYMNAMQTWFEGPGGRSANQAHVLVDTIRNAPKTSGWEVLKWADRANKDVKGVFSRALLLLRLATALMKWQRNKVRQRAPQGNAPWHESFLAGFAVNCHLVSPKGSVPDYADFADDQYIAVDEIDSWLAKHSMEGYHIWASIGNPLREICRFERVALWATAS